MNEAEQQTERGDDESPGEPLNPFYRLTVATTLALIVTILASTAVLLGDPAAPFNRWLSRYGGILIAGEVVLCLLFGLVALASDRRRIEQQRQSDEVSPADE